MTQIATFAYVATLFGFVMFLTFFYDAELHPTVTTFIHATLGVGVVFVPFFIPILIIGSIRCKRLLDSVVAEPNPSGAEIKPSIKVLE